MQEQGFINYSRGNAKLRWMNEQRPKVGGKLWQLASSSDGSQSVSLEELKTSVVMHGHMRAEKVGPATATNSLFWYIPFPSGAQELKIL